MAPIKRVYIDSSCIISYAIAKSRKLGSPEWYTQKLLDAAKDGAIELYSSTLTIAECLGVDSGQIKPSKRVQDLFKSVLASGKVVIPIDADYFVAIDARDLRWKHEIGLKGADGIHLASAVSVLCEEFVTDNTNHFMKKTVMEKQERLKIRIIRPDETKCLPAKYLQDVFPFKVRKSEK